VKRLKKLLSIVIVLCMLAPTVLPAQAVSVSGAQLLVDDVPVSASAYNIDGYTYYKLRDLALLLNGSEKQFDVSYDQAAALITLTPGQAYTPIGGECELPSLSGSEHLPSKASLSLNGQIAELTAYNIGGYTYYKLRDVMSLLDVFVGWNAQRRVISIETDRAYRADNLPLLTTEEVARKARSVVTLLMYDNEGNEIGQASGFFINEDGLIATCFHPIENANMVEIVTDGPYDYDARYNAGRTEYFVPARLDEATTAAAPASSACSSRDGRPGSPRIPSSRSRCSWRSWSA